MEATVWFNRKATFFIPFFMDINKPNFFELCQQQQRWKDDALIQNIVGHERTSRRRISRLCQISIDDGYKEIEQIFGKNIFRYARDV